VVNRYQRDAIARGNLQWVNWNLEPGSAGGKEIKTSRRTDHNADISRLLELEVGPSLTTSILQHS
jgi:hypothetical protein